MLVSGFLLFAGIETILAQTFNRKLHATVNNEYLLCLNKRVTGYWTYHISWHVSPKTGLMTKCHWNVTKAELKDEDGNKYRVIDTGNDNMGTFFWDMYNNLVALNEGYDIDWGDLEDGYMPVPPPEMRPGEGNLINVLKFAGKEGVVTWRTVWRVKIDSEGDVVFDFYQEDMDCNPME